MTTINAGTVDVFVLARHRDTWRVLVLQRSTTTRCPAAWETVHGRIEANEAPEGAASRELREETGLSALRLYSIRVQPFYLAVTKTVELAVGFAAIVDSGLPVTLGEEHQAHEWVSAENASARFVWPSERAGLADCLHLLAGGDAGPVEDVLRIR